MSSKRKNTKPIRVSEILLQCTNNSPTQPDMPAVSSVSNDEWNNIHKKDWPDMEQGSPWQVTLSLPNKPQDLPTMVAPFISSNSKRHMSSAYGERSCDDNPFDILRGSPLTNGEHNDPLMSGSSNSRPAPKKTRKIRYKYHENSQVKYKCDVCHYCTNRSDHYKRHLITHSEDKPLKCLTCGYGTGRSDHFKRHLIRHGLSKEEISSQCEYNGIRSAAQNNTRNHGPFAPGDASTVTPRTKCSASDSPHGGASEPSDQAASKKFSCDICGYSTDRNSHFTRHIRTHSTELPFTCEACGKSFKLETYLKKHRCSVNSKPSTSSTTDASSSQSLGDRPPSVPGYDLLPTSDNLVHDASDQMCATCGMTFDHPSDLSSHACHNLMGTL